MRIAYNPSDKKAYTPISEYNKDIVFDLVSKIIYVRGEPFIGHYETFKKHTSSDNKGGSEGLVPIPSYSTTNSRLLREDGQWVNITELVSPDDELSTESTNAVQNKIITNKINEILASMQLKAADVYKNVKVGNNTLVASGINDTLEFKLGNGIIITPNVTNKTLEFSINATGNQGINTSYDNNQLVVKIQDEYYNKWNAVYDWYISVTKEDTDNLINKWQEIVDFLNSIAEGTNIIDEFVTRKTDQTIIGEKTFSKQIISLVEQGTAPFSVTSATVVSKLNADLLDGVHASELFTALSNDTNQLSITIGGTNKKLIIDYANTAGRLEGGSLATWGTLTNTNGYTNVATYDYGGTKGAFSFAGKGGQLSLQLDGFFYQNEGRFLVLDTNNYSTYLDTRYYTETEINNKLKEYLPLIGGTMSGPLNFANGTWNSVGDDIAMGDYNAAGMLGLKSLNNDIPGVGFHNSSGTLLGKLQAKGSDLYWNDQLIIHGGNNNLGYIGTTAVQSSSAAQALTGITNATISSNINLGGELVWSKNTDYAKIYFKNSGDGDTDSYMDLQTGDNGNEYVKFSRNSGGTISTIATVKSEGIRTYGYFISELNGRYIKIGPQNGSHAHYETDASISHWFNKTVQVDGNIEPYGNNEYSAGSTSYRFSNVYSYLGNFAGVLTTAGLSNSAAYLWNGGQNFYCVPSGNNSEWSFDLGSTAFNSGANSGYTGTYLQVWSCKNSAAIASFYNDTRYVYIPVHLAVGGYDNTSYALSTNSFICNSWIRTKGTTGWYNEDYGGGWYMTDANWIRNYNYKPLYYNINTHNAWGIGTHRLAACFYGSSHVSILLLNTSNGWGLCSNSDGNLYIGFRNQSSSTDTSKDSYPSYLTKNGYWYAAHYYENSDQRLKENIKAILDKDNIPQIKEFDWKESGEHSYGLIAQELEEQGYAELVTTKTDGYKTVNYSAALSLIVGKLQVKIKELEEEIENLKSKN